MTTTRAMKTTMKTTTKMTKKEHRVDFDDINSDDVDSAIFRLMMTNEIHF
jgi:hypothetical protein